MPELVVASFNVHVGVDGWGRPFDVVDACRQLDADVVVLEETWSPLGGVSLVDQVAADGGYLVIPMAFGPGRLLRPPPAAPPSWGPGIRRRRAFGVRLDSTPRAPSPDGPERPTPRGAPGTVGIAMLSRLAVKRTELLDLGRLGHDSVRRGAVLAEIDVGGSPVVVAGTHMSHLRHGSPIQFARLRRSLPSSDTCAVLAGDMNLWGPPLSAMFPGWTRAVRGRTWPAWAPVAQSDHILVTRSVRVRGGEVVRVGGSDHFPVRATLAVG
ncbi:MAG: endonuclease/exonuclease/phosphatase family protein [Acidimicrobiales bacterium]